MCGIVGWIGHGEDFRGRIREALGTIAHRGPDAEGIWLSPAGVCLAGRRLAILDLRADADQPMVRGGSVLVHNGEIYNYVELRERLAREGQRFTTGSDTEVILAAHRLWGDGFLQELNGMFAFALWDDARRELLLARDRFGEKPLYVASTDHCLHFASEIKALLAFPCVRRDPDPGVIAAFVGTGQLPDGGERTFFRGIRRVRPATALHVGLDGSVREIGYWELRADPRSAGLSLEAASERIGALFEDSVRIRLRSDVPIGTSLSGGIDSTLVVRSIARLEGGTKQLTFSARHRSPSVDEGRFIELATAGLRVEPTMAWVTAEDARASMDRLVWHQDEPFAHTSPIAQWKVYESAAAAGVRVMLDGQGADEVFGGYQSLAFGARWWSSLRRGALSEAVREIAAFRRLHPAGVSLILRYIAGAATPRHWRDRARTLRWGMRGFMADGYVAAGSEPDDTCAAFDGEPLKRELCDAVRRRSLPGLLRYADRSSMAHSVEVRLPFLDHRLVEAAFGCEPDALVSRGETKRVLRVLLADVPDIARRHDKIGFATPEDEWFRGPLRSFMDELISASERRGLYRRGAPTAAWAGVLAGRRPSQVAWRLASVELWMRRFVDPRRVTPPAEPTRRALPRERIAELVPEA